MAQGWRVIGQRQMSDLTPQNTFETVAVVQFQLDSGTVGEVKIPVRLYTPEYVQEQVGKLAQHMIAVESLTG